MIRLIVLLCFVIIVDFNIFAQVEVVVTASRVAEDARSTPAYVRVIPEEVVQLSRNVLDALSTLPDINIITTSPGEEYISMGGFGENGFMRTLVLIDGQPINRADMRSISWTSMPVSQIDRIEIVKGPMSSQMGDQAVAGVINIISKKPKGLNTSLSTDYDIVLKGNIQELFLSYGGKRFRFDTIFSHKDFRSFRQNSRSEVVTAEIGPGVTIGNLDIDLTGRYSSVRNALPGGIKKDEFDTNPNISHNNDLFSDTQFSLDFTGNLNLDNTALTTTFFWNNKNISNETESLLSWSDTNYTEVGGTVQASAEFPLGDSLVLNTVGGIDARWPRINVKVYENSSKSQLKSNETPQRMDLGFWGRGQLLIENKKGHLWTINAGARFSRLFMQMASENKIHLPFVFDIGMALIPNKTWNYSLKYGRVFRYPAMDEQASYNGYGASSVNTSLNPEYGHSITASIELRRGRFKAAISPYFTAMTDEIAYDMDVATNVNLDSTYHFGQVISLNWDARRIKTAISYSFDMAQFVDTAKIVPLVPLHTVFTRFTLRPGKKFDITTDTRFSSGYYPGGDTANSSDMIPGRISWNAGVHWNLSTGLLLKLQLTNILNDRTPTSVYYSSWYPSEGRVLTISADWRF